MEKRGRAGESLCDKTNEEEEETVGDQRFQLPNLAVCFMRRHLIQKEDQSLARRPSDVCFHELALA